jgi:hypothetical protein
MECKLCAKLTTVNMALASVASLAAAAALVLPVPLKAHLALATSNTEHGHMRPRGGSGGGCSVAFVWARGSMGSGKRAGKQSGTGALPPTGQLNIRPRWRSLGPRT